MPEFISKLQYKTFEEGEFADEKTRDLEETLTLIKTFPWNEQRGADVQLTGPGMVISGEAGDYLKIGTFYNGKFSVYYIDAGNHLYEYHTDDLDEAYSKVNDFFAGNLNFDGWEKHFFNAVNSAKISTQLFEYRINHAAFYAKFSLATVTCVLYVLGSTWFFVAKRTPPLVICFFLFFGILFLFSAIEMFRLYSRSKNMVLQISKGTDGFTFGNNDMQNNYLKSEMSVVNVYGPVGGRAKQVLTIMEISFNDGRVIKFPGLLIDPLTLLAKLPEKTQINYLERNSLIRKSIWNY